MKFKIKRSFPIMLLVAVFLGVFLSACGGGDGGDGGGGNGDVNLSEDDFFGTATATILYYEYNPYTGQDDFVEEKNYQYNVYVYIKAPLKTGSIKESNPCNLNIYPDRTSGGDEEGYVDIATAALFTVNNTNDLLLQYWNVTLNGNLLEGTLTDTHSAEAAAANLLWAWEDLAGLIIVKPFPIAVNTTMQATITDSAFTATIQGESTDTYRKFTVNIAAQRI